HHLRPQTVREVAREVAVVVRRQPARERAASIDVVIGGLGAQRLRREHASVLRMTNVAAIADEHDLLAAIDAELGARLHADAREVGSEAPVVLLAPFLEGMMMALRALK